MSFSKMSMIMPQQNRIIHALLNSLCIAHMKAEIIHSCTQGRTQHSSELTKYEAQVVISHLKNIELGGRIADAEKLQRLRRTVIAKFREMRYVVGDKADMTRINTTLKAKWGNDLNHLSTTELVKIIGVLERQWIPHFYNKLNQNGQNT